MDIKGILVRVRDRQPGDSVNEMLWHQDKELEALDPPAGKVFNAIMLSVEAVDGIHIGTCGLYNRTVNDIQLGIRIGNRDYWDKGCGTEAVSILVHYCTHMMNIETVWLKVLPWNTRAIKCYAKCGFMHTGRIIVDGREFIRMERRLR